MNEQELKARAYDCLANIEMWQRELQDITRQLRQLQMQAVANEEPQKEVAKKNK